MGTSVTRTGSTSVRRRLAAIIGVLAIASAVAACGGKTDAQQAADALNAGLQAHVAGQLDTAKGHYAECLKHEPKNKLCLYNLGLIAQMQGFPDEAEKDYRLALAVDPQYAPAIFNLAILRAAAGAAGAAGASAEALDLYRRFVVLSPDDATGHLNYGLLLASTGDVAAGNAEIQKAMQLDPSLAAPATPEPTAKATPTSTAKPQATTLTYRVKSGDTLYTIAAQFGTTIKAIVEANGIADPNRIVVGQKLIIPIP